MKFRMILLLLTTGAFFSCKKKEGNISITGQGNGSQFQLFSTDTLGLLATTIDEDSLPGNGLSFSLLGAMSDPLLGKTSASVYAALTLNEPNSDFPNTETPDSAILFVPFIVPASDGYNFYGNRLTKQQLQIRFVTSDISASAVYYQNYAPPVDPTQSTTYTGPLYFTESDSIRFQKGKLGLAPGLRVKLSATMAKTLMSMPKEAYQNNDKLAIYLKGIGLIPDDKDLSNGQGGIGVFDFTNATSLGYRAKILLYYQDTQTFVFTFAGSARTITSGKTGPYPSAVLTQLNSPKQAYQKTYVQSLQGVKTFIRIPSLLNFLKSTNNNIAINKAEITLAVDQSTNSADFYAPPRLNLFRPLNQTSFRNYLLPDAAFTTFGGYYDKATGTYTFLITRHIQDLMSAYFFDKADKNYGLMLAAPSSAPVLAGRTAIDWTSPKTKIKITYTKLN